MSRLRQLAARIAVLAPWITVQKVGLTAAVLMALVLIWAEMLRHRVAAQTLVIGRRAVEDAAWERRSVYLEKDRSVILEAINSTKPLDAVLALIAAFIEKQIQGVNCTFQVVPLGVGTIRKTDHHAEGSTPESESAKAGLPGSDSTESDSPATLIPYDAEPRETEGGELPQRFTISRGIHSSEGQISAHMLLVTEGAWRSNAHTEEVLDIGSRLAALAIENRRLHEQLVRRSEYDQLTDVPNRFLIEQRLAEALAEAKQSGGHVAVVYVDLDEFKQVNDVYGHRVGDLYLKQTAQRLSAQLRNRDLVARIGGDEFLAVIHDISGREEAEGVARRLSNCFVHPFTVEDLKMHGTASIGIAVYPEDGTDVEQLKRTADHAMYAVKRKNKGGSISVAS